MCFLDNNNNSDTCSLGVPDCLHTTVMSHGVISSDLILLKTENQTLILMLTLFLT